MSVVESGVGRRGISEIIPEAMKGDEPSKASVIMARTTTKYYPNGAQTMRSDQNRTIQFRLASSELLDPMTTYLNLRVLAHHPKTRLEDYVHSVIQKAVLKAGGVEIESIDQVGLTHKMLAYASSPQQYVQHTAALCQGAWRFAPKVGQRMTVDHADGNVTVAPAIVNTIPIAASGSLYSENSYGHFPETNPLWNQGNTSNYDHGAGEVSRNRLGDRGIGYGTHYCIPLSEIFGFFKTSRYIPLFALGALDIELQFSPYNECMIEGPLARIHSGLAATNFHGVDVDIDSVGAGMNAAARGAGGEAVANQYRVYECRDIFISSDLCAADPVYTALMQRTVSETPTGITIPFTSMVTQQKTISNAGKNTISVNRGVSFLRSVVVGMRPTILVNEPKRQKSNFYYSDMFKSFQMHVGNKAFPQNKIDSTTQCYEELMKAFGLHNNIHSGSILSMSRYLGKEDPIRASSGDVYFDDQLVTWANAPAAGIPDDIQDPTRQHTHLFLLGLNCEKVSQSNVVSGINLRTSGFNLLLDIELQTPSEAKNELLTRYEMQDVNGTDTTAADQRKHVIRHKPSYAFSNYDIEVDCLLMIDKALSIVGDQVSVAE